MQPAGNQAVNFNAFKDSFSHGMTFLKRRFSSDDLAQDPDNNIQDYQRGPQPQQSTAPTTQTGVNPQQQPQPSQQQRQSVGSRPPPPASRQDFSLQGLGTQRNTTISAPTSPAKSQGPAAMVQGLTRNILQAATQKGPSYNKEHCKCLLVIDNVHTDWSKYFRGKKVLNDWDVRIEQSDFAHISLVSSGAEGSFVYLDGGKIFKPDFILVRQPPRDCGDDWRSVLIGLLFGGVPGLNSMHSIYNFSDRPWVFSHLLMMFRRLGPDKFPLIDQLYVAGRGQLANAAQCTSYPIIVKAGYAHFGVGKIKVNNPSDIADVESVLALHKEYATVEPYIDAKYDLHVQKIGPHYKAFMRKGISNSWKSNQGSAMLEQVAVTDRYKSWVDEVAQLFGGLDMCSVAAIVAKDGREQIYEVSDCSFTLLGETQEEDRRHIADLVLQKMNHILGIKMALQQKENMGAAAPQNFIKHESPSAQQRAPQGAGGPSEPPRPRPPPPAPVRQASSGGQPPMMAPNPAPVGGGPVRQDSQGGPQPPQATGDDTMSNLKKTFAGIFGDM